MKATSAKRSRTLVHGVLGSGSEGSRCAAGAFEAKPLLRRVVGWGAARAEERATLLSIISECCVRQTDRDVDKRRDLSEKTFLLPDLSQLPNKG